MKQSEVLHNTELMYKVSSGNKTIIMDKQQTDETESPKDNIEDLLNRVRDYVETQIELFKYKAIDKTADLISSIVSNIIVAITLMLFFLFLNIGLGIWIGSLLGKTYLGFLILAALYLITGLIINSSKNKWVKEPVTTKLIKALFK